MLGTDAIMIESDVVEKSTKQLVFDICIYPYFNAFRGASHIRGGFVVRFPQIHFSPKNHMKQLSGEPQLSNISVERDRRKASILDSLRSFAPLAAPYVKY